MLRARFTPVLVFAGSFILLLVLYWPARNAGWVSDTLGWLDAVRTQSFGDFVDRSGFGVRSLYQTTQIATWILHRLFGTNRLAWHLLFCALQALNAALLFSFFRQLLRDSKLENAPETAVLALLLFSLSPYLSEVIVWEAAFHYLQGLLFILAQILLLQSFLRTGRSVYAILSGIVFAIASFSLELFYLSPAFSFLLLLFYRFGAPQTAPERIRRASRRFMLPQLVMLALHLILIRVLYGTHTGRLGDGLWSQPLTYFAIKPPDYLLHLLGGRFLPQPVRSAWHRFFCTYAGAGIFYALLAATLSFTLFRFRRMTPRGQLIAWAWCMTLAAMALVTPMWFPERLLVMGDRYLYLMLPFFLLSISLSICSLTSRALRVGLTMLLFAGSLAGTRHLVLLWEQSELLTQTMQEQFPAMPPGGEVVLLNNVANLHGVPMSGAGPDGEFSLMRRLLYPHLHAATVREAFAAEPGHQGYTLTMDSGLLQIRLAGTGRRWWYGADYARAASGSNWTATLVDDSTYVLRFPAGGAIRFVIWNGRTYEILGPEPHRQWY